VSFVTQKYDECHIARQDGALPETNRPKEWVLCQIQPKILMKLSGCAIFENRGFVITTIEDTHADD
jgi:hypothetical protein